MAAAATFSSPPPSVHLHRSAAAVPRRLPLVSKKTRRRSLQLAAAQARICGEEVVTVDRSSVSIAGASAEEELMAAVRLRIRTFYEFRDSYGIEDHKRCVEEREFEALKERTAGKMLGFRRVSCINATLPLQQLIAYFHDLSSNCKFSESGEEHVVIGTLDLNQCVKLADELIGKRPEGIRSDISRAYLSNVCVAEELQRNGLGYELIKKAKEVAQSWGITDLYVHVAVDNEGAKRLYAKSGFTYESEEEAWQARFLGRPKRFLLWTDLTGTCKGHLKTISFNFGLQWTSTQQQLADEMHERSIPLCTVIGFNGRSEALQKHACSCSSSLDTLVQLFLTFSLTCP